MRFRFSERYLITQELPPPPSELICQQDFDPVLGFGDSPGGEGGTEFTAPRLEARARFITGS